MFTGLVKTLGTIRNISPKSDGKSLEIDPEKADPFGRKIGESIAIDGACLTVSDWRTDCFSVDVSQETLQKTALDSKTLNSVVNLEPSLKLGDEVGGHLVSGHVDDTVKLEGLEPRGDFYNLRVRFPDSYKHFIAPKGSVALDGISLTVNEVNGNTFTVRIIPHTYENTTLHAKNPGELMNLEVDMIARYVYNSLKFDN